MKSTALVLSRRSIRKYREGKISKEQIDILLEAAMSAPTARNLRAWEFIIIKEPSRLKTLSEAHPYGKMLVDASLAILVCGDMNIEKMISYQNQNCGAATQNILLAANALNLGAVWLGVYPRKERIEAIAKICKLPNHIVPISLISIGHPDEKKEEYQGYPAEKAHYEIW